MEDQNNVDLSDGFETSANQSKKFTVQTETLLVPYKDQDNEPKWKIIASASKAKIETLSEALKQNQDISHRHIKETLLDALIEQYSDYPRQDDETSEDQDFFTVISSEDDEALTTLALLNDDIKTTNDSLRWLNHNGVDTTTIYADQIHAGDDTPVWEDTIDEDPKSTLSRLFHTIIDKHQQALNSQVGASQEYLSSLLVAPIVGLTVVANSAPSPIEFATLLLTGISGYIGLSLSKASEEKASERDDLLKVLAKYKINKKTLGKDEAITILNQDLASKKMQLSTGEKRLKEDWNKHLPHLIHIAEKKGYLPKKGATSADVTKTSNNLLDTGKKYGRIIANKIVDKQKGYFAYRGYILRKSLITDMKDIKKSSRGICNGLATVFADKSRHKEDRKSIKTQSDILIKSAHKQAKSLTSSEELPQSQLMHAEIAIADIKTLKENLGDLKKLEKKQTGNKRDFSIALTAFSASSYLFGKSAIDKIFTENPDNVQHMSNFLEGVLKNDYYNIMAGLCGIWAGGLAAVAITGQNLKNNHDDINSTYAKSLKAKETVTGHCGLMEELAISQHRKDFLQESNSFLLNDEKPQENDITEKIKTPDTTVVEQQDHANLE